MIGALRIETPDGSGQAVHPDVVDTVDGFAGHRYWMACTPYPFGRDRFENPVVRVSEDGVHWTRPDGAPDPLVDAPPDERRHWSDTDLTLHDGVLHLVFRGCERGGRDVELLVMTSVDGRTWTAPETVWSGRDAVSPALVADATGWRMWHVQCRPGDPDVPVLLVEHRGPRIGEWESTSEQVLDLGGSVPWHVDVVRTPDGLEALVAAYPEGTNPSRCSLFHLEARDDATFVATRRRPVVAPSVRRWNTRMVYRSTFTKDERGHYRIWFSGASWGMRCGIGLVEGPLDALEDVDGGWAAPAATRWREDVSGLASYVGQYKLPGPVQRGLRTVLRRG